MPIKRLRSPKVSCIQHIDANNLTVQEIDDHFEEKQVVPVENVHQPIENVITGVIDNVLTGDFIDLTGDDAFTADDGVILAHKKENVYIGENEDNRTTAAVKKKQKPSCSCSCGCGAYSRSAGGQRTRAVKCLELQHGDAWLLKSREERRMLRAPGNERAMIAENAKGVINVAKSTHDHVRSAADTKRYCENRNKRRKMVKQVARESLQRI